MNFHSDEWILTKLNEHYIESKSFFSDVNMVGIFLQGSQNYGLDYDGSDVDTKLITTPTLDDLVYNVNPISTTHVRENDEHIDFKDIRLYFKTFVKQNLNFLEILFTDYYIINPLYENDWDILIDNRELIARMNPYTAVRSMNGIAWNKMCALRHPYEGKINVLNKYGYDPKQLHHIKRVEEYLCRYIDGEPYIDCLHTNQADYLIDIKRGALNCDDAIKLANDSMSHIDAMTEKFCSENEPCINQDAVDILNNVQYSIIKKSLIMELK